MKKSYFECCMNCKIRKPGCHSSCEEYLADKNEREEEIKKIKKSKEKENVYNKYIGEIDNKIKKKTTTYVMKGNYNVYCQDY